MQQQQQQQQNQESIHNNTKKTRTHDRRNPKQSEQYNPINLVVKTKRKLDCAFMNFANLGIAPVVPK